MEPVHVLGNAAIHDFAVIEVTLDNQKNVFDFATNRRDAVLDLILSVDTRVRCRCL